MEIQRDRSPRWLSREGRGLAGNLAKVDIHITAKEEANMKINATTTQEWRRMYGRPNSDVVEETRGNIPVKRERGASAVVREPQRKAARHYNK